MSKPLIPFNWLPGSWGLKGKSRERAQAEYELDGFELAMTLARLDYTGKERERRELDIKLAYDQIDDEAYEYACADLIEDSLERELQRLEIDREYTVMTDTEYEKKQATIKCEPWVSVIDLNVRDETGNFELDWNDYFVQELKEVGFKGASDEDIVNAWFSRICRDIAISEFGGQGDFDEQLAKADTKTSTADEAGRRIIK
jgi:hypothetical protein